jgi:hypothetical protein
MIGGTMATTKESGRRRGRMKFVTLALQRRGLVNMRSRWAHWTVALTAVMAYRTRLADRGVVGQSMKAVPIGRDVVIYVQRFAMVGRRFRKLRQAVQRGFSMILDGALEGRYPGVLLIIGRDRFGRVHGFHRYATAGCRAAFGSRRRPCWSRSRSRCAPTVKHSAAP